MPASRRKFLKTATVVAASAASGPFAISSSAQESPVRQLKQINTAVLNIAYEESGDPQGTAIVLLHGFPYDVRSFDGVIEPLVQAGHRVLVPYLRGYGATTFLDADSPRQAEQAALAQDLIDFADALSLPSFIVAGFDWGNRAACIAAILHPQRISGQVAIGGYAVQNTITPSKPAPARFEAMLWYQWYFNTSRGMSGLESNRHDIIRHLWDSWSPGWRYSDEDYANSSDSFDNADFVSVVIHSYRHRHGNAPGETRFMEIERELAQRPVVNVPVIVLRGAESGFGSPSPDPTGDQAMFPQLLARRIVSGAGHDLPAHRPDAVAEALLELL